MKKILEILRLKWAEYLLEIIVIVLGILGALMLDNWNEDRKSFKLETEMLMELKDGLEEDTAHLKSSLRLHSGTLQKQVALLDWLASDLPYHDTLSIHFARVASTTIFSPTEGPYETLKQLGIRLISNDSLRKQILNIYDGSYQYYAKVNAQYNEMDMNMVNFTNHKYFNDFELSGRMTPLNVESIKFASDYRYHLSKLENMNGFFIRRVIKPTLREAEETLMMISAELEKRK